MNESLQSLSIPEKLRLLEDVWSSLCIHSGDVESPQWHAEVLAERQRRLAAGEATLSSWEDAKARLQKLGQ